MKSMLDLLHVAKGALNSLHAVHTHRKYHSHGEQNLDVGKGHTFCLSSQEQ